MKIKLFAKKIGEGGHAYLSTAVVPDSQGPDFRVAVVNPPKLMAKDGEYADVQVNAVERVFWRERTSKPTIELVEREDVPDSIWTSHYTALVLDDGSQYSVLDCGALMRSAPMSKETKKAIFTGWEAFPMKTDGEINTEIQLRANSWRELREIIESRHTGLPEYYEK